MSSSSRAWLRLAGAMLAIGLLAALAAAIHEAGATRERLVWQGREAQRSAAAAEALRKEYERGRAASTRYQLDAGALQTRYLALEGISHELRQRVALVLPPVVARDRPDRSPRGARAPAPLPHDAIEAAPPALSATIAIASASLLCGCGTARWREPMSLPVPADLLIPPTRPVLLTPVLSSTTRGTTSGSTRAPAPPTGSVMPR